MLHQQAWAGSRSSMNRIRTIAAVAALVLTATLASTAAAQAAAQYEVSATKNGVVKAHAVYFSANNTLCINLLNAPNPGAYAAVSLYLPDGRLWTSALFDMHNDGVRECKQCDRSFDGQSRHMEVYFHPQKGADVRNYTWILM